MSEVEIYSYVVGENETLYAELGDDYEAIVRDYWEDGDYGDDDENWRVEVRYIVTDENGEEIDRGTVVIEHEVEEPPCDESDDGEHDWAYDRSYSTGGTSFSHHATCSQCGMKMAKHTCGPQRNPGEADTVRYYFN